MNPKNTWILVATAAALFGFIFFFERRSLPVASGASKVLPGLRAAEVTGVQIQPAAQLKQLEIRAERTNGVWRLTRPLAYPAQSLAVERLLEALEELTPQTHLSARELKGQRKVNEDFGLDAPLATIILQQGGRQRHLKLGNLTAPGDQIYAQVVGMEGVDVISLDLLKFVPRKADDWRDTTFVDLKDLGFDRVTAVNGPKSFELQRDATNTSWRIVRPMQARADNSKIQLLLYSLENVRVSRFETDDAKADLEPFGLQPPELELTFDHGTNRLLSLQFGKSPTNEPGQIYARANGGSSVVVVPREQINPWRADFIDFRDEHLVSLAMGAPAIIEINNGRENFAIQRQPDNSWRMTTPYNFPVDALLMRGFLENLAGLKIVRFNGQFAVKDVVTPSDFPKYGLAPAVRRYVLKRDVFVNPAGETNSVIAELDFGMVDGEKDKVFARRADLPEESSVYAVAPGDFQKLPFTSLQLRERRVWNFSENDTSGLLIRQNGKPQQLIRNGPNEWNFAPGSQGMINPLAVEVGVQELGELSAESWVERGDQNRARYGFTENSLQISVAVKLGGQPRVLALEFGGWSPRGLRYASAQMEDGQNWIFEFPARTWDRLTNYFNLHENPNP